MQRRIVRLTTAASLAVIFAVMNPGPARAQSADQVDKLFEKFSWRSLGPAIMGGRTVDIEAVEKQPWIIYAAVGPSGVWKSENAGTTWAPIFTKEATVSVGDIAIAQSSPNTIWAGTGEATCRNSVTIGDGVYKSTDGGKTWTNMGLKDTRHISRIIVNRGDPNIVYVAAMGHLWGPNPDRGIFKTTDGGRTWNKVLYIDENTGVADLAADWSDSQILYAAAYEHRRLPWLYTSGGKGSGLFRSLDGGTTWTKLTKDLPEGLVGRIGLGTSRSAPGVVYALIEHAEGSLFRSEDRGETWKRMCPTGRFRQVANRPFYYSQVQVDPADDRTVYVCATSLNVSHDSGQTYTTIGQEVHSDHHALWIDPANSLHLIAGNDGGIDISWDGGKKWQSVQSIDAAEVYNIGFDLRRPYYVYCGLQDNNVWGGPSATLDAAGILNSDWFALSGGDGFFAQPDPLDPAIVFANSQMNGLVRFDGRIGKAKPVRPEAPRSQPPYRFNWNSPVLLSSHDSRTVYCGAQYLLRSPDSGRSWQVLSPDLTTNDPAKQTDSGGPITPDNSGAEVHCTITTVAESPLEKGVLWCGTDDGNVQLSRDDGRTWASVGRSIKGLPPNTWCARLEASHFDPGTAYAAFDGHRTDDYAPYVFKTADFGKTWTSLRSSLPSPGWVHVIREDPKNRNLLWVGTEFGIFVSLDGGKSWFSLRNNLPTVAVTDIAVHPRERDLIIGTHGRGLWILDDIGYLQEMSPAALAEDLHVFTTRPVTAFEISSLRSTFDAPDFAAKNPPSGLAVTFAIAKDLPEQPRLVIADAQGKNVFEMKVSKKAGLQREYWSLNTAPEKDGKKLAAPILAAAPLTVDPGDYVVRLEAGSTTRSQPVKISPDPRFEFNAEDRQARYEAAVRALVLSQRMGLVITASKSLGREVDRAGQDLKARPDAPAELLQAFAAFRDKEKKLEDEIVPKEYISLASRNLALRGTLNAAVVGLTASIIGYPAAPTETELRELAELEALVDSQVKRVNELVSSDLESLNDILKKNGMTPLAAPAFVK
jgi:photosystem II stability/assembly factor-like uncharacterized protein